MKDFLFALVLASVGAAIVMELVKAVVNKIRSKKPPVDGFVWRLVSIPISALATFLAWEATVTFEAVEPNVLLSPWLMAIWMLVLWWAQLLIDMKVVKQLLKKYGVPLAKKLLSKKLGVDDVE